jgi:UDPglucose--hexose-1-phosphate uridylyltransferase
MSEIRYNHLDKSYVIIAPERLHRPDHMSWQQEKRDDAECPFCEGNEKMTPPEIYALRSSRSKPNEPGWQCRVVPNLYKAVQIESQYGYNAEGMNEVWKGFGAHEVIIDIPEHLTCLAQWNRKHYINWFKAISQRVADLRNDHRIVFISLFKNHGAFAGATQPHPHTQLIGLPIIPRDENIRFEHCYHHYQRTGRALLDDILAEEEKDGKRIVAKLGAFTAYCPYASQFPFEVMIAAGKGVTEIDTMDSIYQNHLAELMQLVFKKMHLMLGFFDFNLSFAIAPLQPRFEDDRAYEHIESMCRFHIHVIPRIYRHGGFEISTGTMINSVEPERSAKLLREAEVETK